MKLDVKEVYTVAGSNLSKPIECGTRAEALAAIQATNKPGVYTVEHTEVITAAGAGVDPGKPATGQPAAKK